MSAAPPSAPSAAPTALGEEAGLAAILDSLSLSSQSSSSSSASSAPPPPPPGGAAIHSEKGDVRAKFANVKPHDDDELDDDDEDDEDDGDGGNRSPRVLPPNRWHFLMYTNLGIDCGRRRPIILISRRSPGWTEFTDAEYALERKGGFLPNDRWSTNDDPAGTFVFLRKDVIPLPILEKCLEKNKTIAYMLICGGHTWTDEERKAYFSAARADLLALGCPEDVALSSVVEPEEGYDWEPVQQPAAPA